MFSDQLLHSWSLPLLVLLAAGGRRAVHRRRAGSCGVRAHCLVGSAVAVAVLSAALAAWTPLLLAVFKIKIQKTDRSQSKGKLSFAEVFKGTVACLFLYFVFLLFHPISVIFFETSAIKMFFLEYFYLFSACVLSRSKVFHVF